MQQGEAKAKRLLAKNFLDIGVPIDDVVKATGLAEDEILAMVQE